MARRGVWFGPAVAKSGKICLNHSTGSHILCFLSTFGAVGFHLGGARHPGLPTVAQGLVDSNTSALNPPEPGQQGMFVVFAYLWPMCSVRLLRLGRWDLSLCGIVPRCLIAWSRRLGYAKQNGEWLLTAVIFHLMVIHHMDNCGNSRLIHAPKPDFTQATGPLWSDAGVGFGLLRGISLLSAN